jgi:hypothetical protein
MSVGMAEIKADSRHFGGSARFLSRPVAPKGTYYESGGQEFESLRARPLFQRLSVAQRRRRVPLELCGKRPVSDRLGNQRSSGAGAAITIAARRRRRAVCAARCARLAAERPLPPIPRLRGPIERESGDPILKPRKPKRTAQICKCGPSGAMSYFWRGSARGERAIFDTTDRAIGRAHQSPVVSGIGNRRRSYPLFVVNYGAWRALSQPSKNAYVAGALDALINPGSTDAYEIADAKGVSNCALGAGFTPAVLAEMLDRRYAQHSEEWSYGAASELGAALVETCTAQINEERRKGGLSVLE